MHVLALDIGLRRTGCAFGDTKSGIIMALDTVRHETSRGLVEKILTIVQEKKVQHLVVGMPLLLSGEEGDQARIVREVIYDLERDTGLPVQTIDERYTTMSDSASLGADSDALAACRILGVFLDRRKGIDM